MAKVEIATMSFFAAVQSTNFDGDYASNPLNTLYGDNLVGGESVKSTTDEDGKDYISDQGSTVANQYNLYVSNSYCDFVVDESDQYVNYNAYITSCLLANFTSGTGAENYLFPHNGTISKSFIGSEIVNSALEEYKISGEGVYRSSFGADELANNAEAYKTPFNVAGLIGSATITIEDAGDVLKVTIFNVTSITSGAFTAKGITNFIDIDNEDIVWPESYVRKKGEITPYGNISQTFSFTIPKPSSN